MFLLFLFFFLFSFPLSFSLPSDSSSLSLSLSLPLPLPSSLFIQPKTTTSSTYGYCFPNTYGEFCDKVCQTVKEGDKEGDKEGEREEKKEKKEREEGERCPEGVREIWCDDGPNGSGECDFWGKKMIDLIFDSVLHLQQNGKEKCFQNLVIDFEKERGKGERGREKEGLKDGDLLDFLQFQFNHQNSLSPSLSPSPLPPFSSPLTPLSLLSLFPPEKEKGSRIREIEKERLCTFTRPSPFPPLPSPFFIFLNPSALLSLSPSFLQFFSTENLLSCPPLSPSFSSSLPPSPSPSLLSSSSLSPSFSLSFSPSPQLVWQMSGGLPFGTPFIIPVSCSYSGHQFGASLRQLGDGRVISVAEFPLLERIPTQTEIAPIETTPNKTTTTETTPIIETTPTTETTPIETTASTITRIKTNVLQLKGIGKTAFSKHGDGLLPLSSALREAIATEAFFHLDVPVTRVVSVTASRSKYVRRDRQDNGNFSHPREGAEPASVLSRYSTSFIRIGTFEFFSERKEWENLKTLILFCIEKHFSWMNYFLFQEDPSLFFLSFRQFTPLLSPSNKDLFPTKVWPKIIKMFLKGVAGCLSLQASLLQSLGFVHGVLNSDNIHIAGTLLDLGPFGFQETYLPNHSPNLSDDQKIYSFRQQVAAYRNNLNYLVEALAPLLREREEGERGGGGERREKEEQLREDVLGSFDEMFDGLWARIVSLKLGFSDSFVSSSDRKGRKFLCGVRCSLFPRWYVELFPPLVQNQCQVGRLLQWEEEDVNGVEYSSTIACLLYSNISFSSSAKRPQFAPFTNKTFQESVHKEWELFLSVLFSDQKDYTLSIRSLSTACPPLSSQSQSSSTQSLSFIQWLHHYCKIREHFWLLENNSSPTSNKQETEKIKRKRIITSMNGINPFIIPRNGHVNFAISSLFHGNRQPFDALLKFLQNPFNPSFSFSQKNDLHSCCPTLNWSSHFSPQMTERELWILYHQPSNDPLPFSCTGQ